MFYFQSYANLIICVIINMPLELLFPLEGVGLVVYCHDVLSLLLRSTMTLLKLYWVPRPNVLSVANLPVVVHRRQDTEVWFQNCFSLSLFFVARGICKTADGLNLVSISWPLLQEKVPTRQQVVDWWVLGHIHTTLDLRAASLRLSLLRNPSQTIVGAAWCTVTVMFHEEALWKQERYSNHQEGAYGCPPFYSCMLGVGCFWKQARQAIYTTLW